MIIREYLCNDCGARFETASADPSCPSCTSPEAERAFFTPPGIKSRQTAFKDETVKQLAADYGLSDVSNKDGKAVKRGGGGQFMSPNLVQQLPIPNSARDQFSPLSAGMVSPTKWRRERA